MSAIRLDNLTIERPAVAWHADGRAWFVGLLALFVTISSVTWRQPVTSMPMNRNDAAFYLVLAHNLVEHGVYSHHQTEPFSPHTEWPPGVPMWYAIPMAVAGGFPLGSSAWIVHAWTWLTAMLAAWSVLRYLRLFCSTPVALAITAATVFSRAFLDEAQAAFADIPALAASFLVLFEIERHFASSSPSRWRHVGLLLSMSLLPLVKPYLGIVFVAYLWKILAQAWSQRSASACAVRLMAGGVARLAMCCVPFVGFMTYSVVAARDSGTISAVTWLTTDNAVAQREGVAAADPKTLGEWVRGAIATARYHLVHHIASSPFPLLDRCGLTDWPTVPRWGVVSLCLTLFAAGMIRSLRGREGAAAVYTASMLAVFAVLGCDSARYFVILVPLTAWMIWNGAMCVVAARRAIVVQYLSVTLLLLAIGSGFVWARDRQGATLDSDPLFQDVYSTLFELRNRDDVSILAVPYPFRELAIVETGKRVMTHDELMARSAADLSNVAVLVVERTSSRADSFVAPKSIRDLLATVSHETLIQNESLHVRRWRPNGRQPSDVPSVNQP